MFGPAVEGLQLDLDVADGRDDDEGGPAVHQAHVGRVERRARRLLGQVEAGGAGAGAQGHRHESGIGGAAGRVGQAPALVLVGVEADHPDPRQLPPPRLRSPADIRRRPP